MRKLRPVYLFPLVMLFCSLLPHPAEGDGVKLGEDGGITVTGEYAVVITKLPFTMNAPDADFYYWHLSPAMKAQIKHGMVVVTEAPEGSYDVHVSAVRIDWANKKVDQKDYSASINVGKLTPPDPGPGPDPKPPVPPDPPKPEPGPIPAKGMHVLIVFNSEDVDNYPKAQADVLSDYSVREYLRAKCTADGEAGDSKAYRIWDKDSDLTYVPEKWKVAMGLPRTSLPWIVISTDSGGFQGPLPANSDETLKLLKKYGG